MESLIRTPLGASATLWLREFWEGMISGRSFHGRLGLKGPALAADGRDRGKHGQN